MAKYKLMAGKKGVFLTFIAISMVAAFVIIFTPSEVELDKDILVVKTRVSNLNEYVVDIENVYLERALDASGTKSVIALVKYMENQNTFLSDFESSFSEVILQGTINGQPIDSFIEPDVMANSTYPELIERIRLVADDSFNSQSSFSINGIKVYQTRPWALTAEADIHFFISSETASWDKNMTILSDIDIQRFGDPYYSINTAGAYTNRINRTDVKANEWDVNKVLEHIRHGTYFHYAGSSAPNFIMRFTNDIANSSCCGIESLVNPNKLADKDQMESYADYLFFNHSYKDQCTQLYNVTSLWPEFRHLKLDFEHLVLYNLTGASFVRSC